MKKLMFIVTVTFILLLSCDKNSPTANICGCEKPQKNLPWLKELISKAEIDQTGNYKGTIWFLNYKSRDMFVTNMMMGSGGILYYFFDCDGKNIIWKEDDEEDLYLFSEKLKTATVIYTNTPL